MNKISSMLDSVANRLEAKGLVKEAYEVDMVSNMLESRIKYAQEETTILNYTPHPVTVQTSEGKKTYPPTGEVPRVNFEESSAGEIDGVPLKVRKPGKATGLPPKKPGTYYIVSSLILSAVPDREDLIAPDTGKSALRDESGRIQAVKGFVKN